MEYRAKEIHHFFYLHIAIVYVARRYKRLSQFDKICLFACKAERIFEAFL